MLTAAVLALAAGCRPTGQADASGPLPVAVSIIPECWLVRQVGGARVSVEALVAPGESPHTYQPNDAQVSRLMRAAVFFRIGAAFEKEPWFQAIQAAQKVRVVDLRDGVQLREESPHEHLRQTSGPAASDPCDDEGKDPHVWLSPRLLKIQAATVARTLGEADPAHEAEYDQNLAALDSRLDQLDQTLRAKLAPLRGKAFFVFHPAWGYFADEYGLRQISVEVEGKEPSDQELTELQREVRRSGAKVVFVQPQISGRSARAVAEAAGARLEQADDLAEDLPGELLRLADALVKSYP
jgi:zinc transport system substrate-binding protein